MIKYVVGNILESSTEAIVNTVNTVGVMGKGLALQFKKRFPNNYTIYRKACEQGEFHIGEMLVTEYISLDRGKKYIINFPTKTHWKLPSEYCYIETGLEALKKEIINRHLTSVAIPPLGTRNGGLDWNKVKNMIVEKLKDLDCEVFIYEPTQEIDEHLKKERVSLTPARLMMLGVMVDLVAHGELLSEFAAEKIVYFLQRFGAQDVFKLSFNRGVYGPYSGKVRYVLRYLNGSYIMGMSDLSKHPFDEISLVADAKTIVSEALNRKENDKYLNIVNNTTSFLSKFYSNYSLELLATIDFLLQTEPNLKEWRNMDNTYLVEILTNNIAQWNSRKERLFTKPQYIHLMVDHLKTSQL